MKPDLMNQTFEKPGNGPGTGTFYNKNENDFFAR
jgi:hypothetical protein